MQIFKLELNTEFGYRKDYNYKPVRGRSYIPYGEDNQLDSHLRKLLSSPTHSALLKLEQNLVFGGGFLYDKNNTPLKDFIKINDLNDVLDKSAHDFCKYGGFYLQVIWSKDGKSIASVSHQDFSTVRIDDEILFEPKSFHLCFDWSNERVYGTTELPAYNPKLSKSEPVQILYTREYISNTKFYPQIPYYGGLKAIALESSLESLKLNSVKNGLTTSGMFIFKEVLDPAERKALKQNIKNDFTGEDGQRYIAVFANSKDTAPEFVPIQSDNHSEMYSALNDIAVQKILTSHRASYSVANLPGSSSLFNNEISTSFEYYNSLVVEDFKQVLLRTFNKIFEFNNLLSEGETVSIKQLNPIQFKASENLIMRCVKINEARNMMLGLDSIEGGDELILPSTTPQINVSPTTDPSVTSDKSLKDFKK